MYKWIEPKICREDLMDAIRLPPSGEKKDCPPCNPGFYNNGSSSCHPCPSGTFSDGTKGKVPITNCTFRKIILMDLGSCFQLIFWGSL